MTPFETYCLYVAMKNHFTSKTYDAVKYNFKVKASRVAFDKRKDKFFFEKLSKHDDPKYFLLANFVNGSKQWVRDLAYSPEARLQYEQWLKRSQSLTYTIENDCANLDPDFDSNFICKDGMNPRIISLFLSKQISLETLTVVSDLVGCRPYWQKTLKNDPVIEDLMFRINKYMPFINYDKEKIRNICIDIFSL